MSGIILESGIELDQLPSDELEHITRSCTSAALASRDVDLFEGGSRRAVDCRRSPVEALDAVWEKHDIENNSDKRVNRSSHGAALGMQLVGGLTCSQKCLAWFQY